MKGSKKRTILCVDDEPEIVGILVGLLKDNHTVRTALNGKQALDIFLAEDISLVITDQGMPEMHGTELLAVVNSLKPACKKILLTGHQDINSAIDAINIGGVDKYITKPFDKKELQDIVARLLRDYSVDEYITNITGDVKNFKTRILSLKNFAETCCGFLETMHAGVCLLGKNEEIEYANTEALKILQCTNLSRIKGKPFTDFFVLDKKSRKQFYADYMKNERATRPLDIRRDDKTTTLQTYLTFDEDTGKIVGIMLPQQKFAARPGSP